MRHVMEDLGSVCPVVQILDLPVPHVVDQLAELLNLEEDVLDAGRLVDRFFHVPELVIEVPKISLDVIPLRTLVPEPLLAEQLVEVPTTVSYSSFQRTVEQLVDIPVPGGGGSVPGLQGFLPRQPACCRRPPCRSEGIRGLASLVWPSSFVVLFWEEEEEEEEEQEETLQVFFWCADTALCAQVSALALFPRAVFPLYGPLYLTVTCSLFSWFDIGYNLRQFTLAFV